MEPAILQQSSPNWDERAPGCKADYAILHYTGMLTADLALNRLCDPSAKVSAHYMIGRGGEVWQLVDESRRAWHAGKSYWRGVTDLNSVSIGIELVNPGHQWGYQKFPERQIEVCAGLLKAIMVRHNIPAANILAHSDIAPERKEDPGEFFPWQRLAGQGIGLWLDVPDPADAKPAELSEIRDLLRRIGYECPPGSDYDQTLRRCLLSFQRHWFPGNLTGLADACTIQRLRLYAAAAGDNRKGS